MFLQQKRTDIIVHCLAGFHLILMHVQTYKLSSLTEFYTDPHVDPQTDRFKRVSSSLSRLCCCLTYNAYHIFYKSSVMEAYTIHTITRVRFLTTLFFFLIKMKRICLSFSKLCRFPSSWCTCEKKKRHEQELFHLVVLSWDY